MEDQEVADSRVFLSIARKSHRLKEYGADLFIFLFTVLLVGR